MKYVYIVFQQDVTEETEVTKVFASQEKADDFAGKANMSDDSENGFFNFYVETHEVHE